MENRTIKKKTVCLLYSFILTVVTVSGIVDGFASSRYSYKYYTYQSNILVAVVYGIQTVLCIAELAGCRRRLPVFVKGLITLAIMVTFLTVFLLIDPFVLPTNWLDARIHFVVPLAVLVEWIVFEPHGKLRAYYPFCWLIVPAAYLGYVFVLVKRGIRFGVHRVPYFFLDYQGLGWLRVIAYIIMLAVLFLAVGMLMVVTDRLLGRKRTRRPENNRKNQEVTVPQK